MQLFLESFDHYADADKATKWTQYTTATTGSTSIAAVGARSTNGLRMTGSGFNAHEGSMQIVLAPSGTTAVAGVRFRNVTAFTANRNGTNSECYGVDGSCLMAFRYLGTTQIWVQVMTSGVLNVYRGSTLLGTTSAALTQNVYQYIEWKVLFSTTVGTVQIKIDGISVLSLTGLNTCNQGTAAWNEFRLGPHGATGPSGTTIDWNFDDLYILDGSGTDGWTDFMGDMAIYATYPNAAGNYSDFTRSTGTDQWATIDESSANGDTDYNSSATLNAKDTLNFPAAPVTGGTILGIQVVCQVKKSDAGSAGHKAMTRISATDYSGTEVGVPSSYKFVRQQWGQSPATSAAWTEAEYNAAEFGYTKST